MEAPTDPAARLARRGVAVLAVLSLVAATVFAGLEWDRRQLAQRADELNRAGRLRMLARVVMGEAWHLEAEPDATEAKRESIRRAAAELQRAFEDVPLDDEQTAAMLRAQVERFVASARDVAAVPRAELAVPREALAAQLPMLVAGFERLAERKQRAVAEAASRHQHVAAGLVCGTLVALVVAWMGVMQPLLRRLRAQHLRLSESEQRFRAIAENAFDAITEWDSKGRMLFTSRRSLELAGERPEDLLDRGWDEGVERVHRSDLPRVLRAIRAAGEERQPARAVYRFKHRDGDWRHLDMTVQPFDTAGGELHLVTVTRDVTPERQARSQLERANRELRRSNQELEQFAYMASHDLQEPLRMVASYVQLLERRYGGRLDEDADRFIAYASEGASRMQRMIEDLLAYSRVGRGGEAKEPVVLVEALEAACANLQRALTEAGAQVSTESLPEVRGELGLLTQLFQNLISNALKYRSEDAPRIDVDAVRCEEGWQIRVVDNGIGIAAEHAERVFRPFQRLHERGRYPGTGIGLAIARKIVEHHGGRIWVEPDPGGGSRFCFTLQPLGASEESR